MVWTHTGALVISNVPGKLFTIEISGNKVEGYDDNDLLFEVDGRFLKIQTINKKELLAAQNIDRLDDKAALRIHRDRYGSSLSVQTKFRPSTGAEYIKLDDGSDALCWSYEDPSIEEDDTQLTVKEFYLSAVKGNWIFLLKASLTRANTDTDESVRQLLLYSMNSLKLRDSPLSLEKASQMVKQGKM
jgi:hypothetical protein